jgi:hypothetical protein
VVKVVQNGKEIDRIAREKNIPPKRITAELGYAKGSTNAYKRIIARKSPLGLCELAHLAKLLHVTPFDIVDAEHRDDIPSVTLEEHHKEDDLHEAMYGYEKDATGRLIVLNSFPSMIYVPTTEGRRKRYALLMGLEKGLSLVINHEYYPLRPVLRFGFDPLTPFTKDQRIEILDHIVHKVLGEDASKGLGLSVITDTERFESSPFAGNLTILGKKGHHDTLILTMPFYEYAILVVRSHKIATKVAKDVNKLVVPHVLNETKTMEMLAIMMDCLKEDRSLPEFARLLGEHESSFYAPVLDMLPAELRQAATGNG